jgi:hypothetical protein
MVYTLDSLTIARMHTICLRMAIRTYILHVELYQYMSFDTLIELRSRHQSRPSEISAKHHDAFLVDQELNLGRTRISFSVFFRNLFASRSTLEEHTC